MGSRLHYFMLTKVVALCHDKLHGCGTLMRKVILGKSCLNSWTRNTRGGTVHHHDSRVFNRLFDDGAIVFTDHGTLDDGSGRPSLFDTFIPNVSGRHEVVPLEKGCREHETKGIHSNLEVDGTVSVVNRIDCLDMTTRKP